MDLPPLSLEYPHHDTHPSSTPPKKQSRLGPFMLMETLGVGEFGKVKLGIHVETHQEVAIKLIRKADVETTSRLGKVEKEISVLQHLRHPHIVKLYDVIETEKYIGIILDYASGGELFEHILVHKRLRERDARKIFAQLISTVHYMHQKNIVHRDLKLENLLLDKDYNLVVTDFGFANQFSVLDDLMATSCGSPCYAAPELVTNKGFYGGTAADVWSCGVILYAMLCGYLPFDDDPANPNGDNISLLYRYILSTALVLPDYVSPTAKDLLLQILVPDPLQRCTLDTVLKHPWLSTHRDFLSKTVKELERESIDSSQYTATSFPFPLPQTESSSSVSSGTTNEGVPPVLRSHPISVFGTFQSASLTLKAEEEKALSQAIKETIVSQGDYPQQHQQQPRKESPLPKKSLPETTPHGRHRHLLSFLAGSKSMHPHPMNKELGQPAPQPTSSTSARLRSKLLASVRNIVTPPHHHNHQQYHHQQQQHSSSSLLGPRLGQNASQSASIPPKTISPSYPQPNANKHSSMSESLVNKRRDDKGLGGAMARVRTSMTRQPKDLPMTHSAAKAMTKAMTKDMTKHTMNARSTHTTHTAVATTRPSTKSTPKSTAKPPTTNKPPVISKEDKGRGVMTWIKRRSNGSAMEDSGSDGGSTQMPLDRSSHRSSPAPAPAPAPAPTAPASASSAPEAQTSSNKDTATTAHPLTVNTDILPHHSIHSNTHSNTHSPSRSTTYTTHQHLSHPMPTNLRRYLGPIDRRVLTSRAPMDVLLDLIRLLTALGIDVKNDVGYKVQCSRRAHRTHSPSHALTTPLTHEPIYGDPSIDSGDQVLFDLEMCQCSDMALYILDCQWVAGSESTYQFIIQKLLALLDLGSV
ncbi:kinase-like domain-containing protein [Spinellus fusiger]|nr:kinase-like domain-containing protein [Spinellus fusiger]